MSAAARRSVAGNGQRAIGVIALLAALVVVWQLVVSIFEVPRYLLPPPLDVARALWTNRSALMEHTVVTLTEVGLGLGVGLLLGLLLAIVMSRSTVLHNALYVPILATQTTPIVAIAPILIIWFGVGIVPKIIIITIFSFFPVLVNTLAGLQATGRQMVQLMESVAASEWQIYRYIRIPMALPHIFAGFRLAAAASVVGAIVVEWVSSSAGLGYLLLLYQSRLNIDKAFATLVILMLVGVAVFLVTAVLERQLSWSKRLGID